MTPSKTGGPAQATGEDILSPENLARVEERFRAAWTGARSTPFIVEAPIPAELRAEAIEIARRLSFHVLFSRCPTLAVWAVLTPLAENYGRGDNEVYAHIERFLGKHLSDAASRDALKARYRKAARGLGIPISGTAPTELFFAPLGPARSKHPLLADAFIYMALLRGLPPVEDTPSARTWQRRAVRMRHPAQARLYETITFDTSAHCARRFEAWRQGADPINDNEESLFEAYTRAMNTFGRKKSDFVGPPEVFWLGNRLALQAEPSSRPQTIKTGAFPTRIKSGGVVSIDPPWPAEIPWSCGRAAEPAAFAPGEGEVLLFDAASGSLLARAAVAGPAVEVAAERIVALSASGFSAPSFGPALPARDPEFHVAWVERGDYLTFEAGGEVPLVAPREAALWIDGETLARDGSRALLSGTGKLVLSINPEIGGPSRIIRARIGDRVRYADVTVGEDGAATVLFGAFGLDIPGDPARVRFEVLAPGAAGDLEARAELAATSWVWPGMTMPADGWQGFARPGNFRPGSSAGLVENGEELRVDEDTYGEKTILGLESDGELREFTLVSRGDRLWHYSVDAGARRAVPRGARLVFGHAARHDSLIVQSTDMSADLLVLGQEMRTPFRSRSQVEIGPEALEAARGPDDRIALRRADGRIVVLARLRRVKDLAGLEVTREEDGLSLHMTLQEPIDALRVVVEAVDGSRSVGEKAFGRRPVDRPLPGGITAETDPGSNAVTVRFHRRPDDLPARAILETRETGSAVFHPLRDGDLVPIALGLPGVIPAPGKAELVELARFLADPEPRGLQGQLATALGPAYRAAFEAVGASRMVGTIKQVLDVERGDAGPPRTDLAGVAPWIFEKPAQAFTAIAPGSYLAGLARMGDFPAPGDPPDPEGDDPLATWLERISKDATLPPENGPDALERAFRALRNRLADTDLGTLREDGPIGAAAHLVSNAYIAELDALRVFDAGGGGDPYPARLAAAVERFARAAALGRAAAHIEDLEFRTGLSRAEIGQALTMMLRAGLEFFTYFRALWAHARESHDRS